MSSNRLTSYMDIEQREMRRRTFDEFLHRQRVRIKQRLEASERRMRNTPTEEGLVEGSDQWGEALSYFDQVDITIRK